MWSNILQLIIKHLLKPLLIDGVVFLYKSIKEYFRKKKLKKDNAKKVDDYEKADNREENSDTFSNLP